MAIRTIGNIIGAVSVALIIAACATTQAPANGPAPTESSVNVEVLSLPDIRGNFGETPNDDPFVVPSATLVQQSVDFVVLKITVVAAGPAKIELGRADAIDADGAGFASYYDPNKFRDLVKSLSQGLENNPAKLQKIDWNYLNPGANRLNRGTHTFIIVLVGQHPLPHDLTARVNLSLNDDPKFFRIPIPNTK